MSDSHEEEWLKIHARFYGVENLAVDSDEKVAEHIEQTVIQLRALYHRFNHTMLRRESRMTSGEYNALYPRDDKAPRFGIG